VIYDFSMFNSGTYHEITRVDGKPFYACGSTPLELLKAFLDELRNKCEADHGGKKCHQFDDLAVQRADAWLAGCGFKVRSVWNGRAGKPIVCNEWGDFNPKNPNSDK